MVELSDYLQKRRRLMVKIVLLLAIIAIVASYFLTITPSNYFGGKYNYYLLYFLILYKLIELPSLYYILFHKHLINLKNNTNYKEKHEKIKKHSKLLLFLIPQGNTVFGIIAYKLTGNIIYFLLFSTIALITLFLVKPNKLLD